MSIETWWGTVWRSRVVTTDWVVSDLPSSERLFTTLYRGETGLRSLGLYCRKKEVASVEINTVFLTPESRVGSSDGCTLSHEVDVEALVRVLVVPRFRPGLGGSVPGSDVGREEVYLFGRDFLP